MGEVLGAVVLGPAKTAVLPVLACGLGRTLLGVEVRNAYWRQFHAMRVQAFMRPRPTADAAPKPVASNKEWSEFLPPSGTSKKKTPAPVQIND